MVTMRRRRYDATYDVKAMVQLEAAAADAISELSGSTVPEYKCRIFTGAAMTLAPYDYVHFKASGTALLPPASQANAGNTIMASKGTGLTCLLEQTNGNTILVTTSNIAYTLISNGTDWVRSA